jgi:hypothetical protein
MTTLVSGILVDPSGNIIPNADIVLNAISTSFVVLSGAAVSQTSDANGVYSFALEVGNYSIYLAYGGKNYFYGAITITSTTVPSTLNQLLNSSLMAAEMSPDYLTYFQQQTGILLSSFSTLNSSVTTAVNAAGTATSQSDIAVNAANTALTAYNGAIGLSKAYATMALAQADITAGKIPNFGLFSTVSTDPSQTWLMWQNVNGTPTAVLDPTSGAQKTYPSGAAVDAVSGKYVTLSERINALFSTAAPGLNLDVFYRNAIGLIAGGIDESGAFNFGKMISNAATITSAQINELATNNLNTNSINVTNAEIINTIFGANVQFSTGARIANLLPPGFLWSWMNSMGQTTAGIENDGTLSAGKLKVHRAQIDQFINDVVFKGGSSTTDKLPPGFLWAPVNAYSQIALGLDYNGVLQAGKINVKKLIAQEIDSPSLTATKKPIARFLADLLHIPSYGQSLSTGINGEPIQTTTPIPNAFRNVGGVRAQDGPGTPAENHASLVPYIETQHTTDDGEGFETPLGGTLTAILDRLAAEAEGYTPGDFKFLGSAPGEGSQGISALSNPNGPYIQRFNDDITYGLARANELGLTYDIPAIIYLGNESDQSAGTTPEFYKSTFLNLVTERNNYISPVIGKTANVPWFIYQFNSWINRTPNTAYPTIPMALLDLARNNDNISLALPMYMFDYYDTAHLTGLSYKICGYYFGIAIVKQVFMGESKFEPLWSKDVSLQGGMANIYYNPISGLKIDTSLVADPGNYGVTALDPSGNALTITEVSVHLDRLRVRATGGIPSGSKIRLGFNGGTTGQLPSRTTGPRCCIRDNQGDTIKFDPNGIGYRMDNYAIVEEITLN